MSIGSVGTGGGGDTAALERQLQADMKALQDAQRARSAQAVIAADQARVQTDQMAIAAASSGKVQATSTAETASATASGSGDSGSADQSRTGAARQTNLYL